mmetsp:Transcript_98379/g.195039  ORF Transcript_98379/g.195039 Transcript_98379/m.195039 type:complete len:194 (-) Transcript_98379:107-688(-)
MDGVADGRHHAAHAREELSRLRDAPRVEQAARSALVAEHLKQAEEKLRRLQHEARTAPPTQRPQMAVEERVLRCELHALAKQLERMRRDMLLGPGGLYDSSDVPCLSLRDSNSQPTEAKVALALRPKNNCDELKQAQQLAAECEAEAIRALQGLREQREQLILMKDNMGGDDGLLVTDEAIRRQLETNSCELM